MWPILTFILRVCYANWPNSIGMQQKEIAKGTNSSEAPVLEACPRAAAGRVKQLVAARGGSAWLGMGDV